MSGQSSASKVQIGSLIVGTNLHGKPEALEVLQGQVMRFADNYATRVAQAVDDYTARVISPEARIEAVRWKLGQATAAWVDATGVNPVLNVLDLVVLATASRMVMEDEIKLFFGPEGLPLLEAHRRLETEVWTAANRVLRPEQQRQLLQMIEEWRRNNPNQRYVATTRFRELAIAIGQTPERATSGPNSIFSLLYLDPMAGLDPTAAAIQETRQMAERAMYYGQRMPTLLNWQVQLLSLLVAAQPEAKQLLADAGRLSRSTETFAQVAEQFPKLVIDQREAAINQILAGVAAERTNLLASLATEEQKASALLAEALETLTAGNQMAISVNTAVQSLDAFVRSVSPATNRPASSTNSKPFNVLDYGTAAGQVGAAARDLGALMTSVNESTPQLARLRQEATVDAQRVVQRAFWLGLVLILILLAGSVVAGLAYRLLAAKFAPARGQAGSPSLTHSTPSNP